MSRAPSPFTLQEKLNRSTPAAAEGKLGDILADVIAALNAHSTAIDALISDHNTLRTKLNADAGVTDTNYAAATATSTAAVTTLANR